MYRYERTAGSGMKVHLKAVGNPDRDEPSDMGVPEAWVPVSSLSEASKVCRGFIQDNDLGASNWAGGEIQDGHAIVAKVSYNGHVWSPKGEKLL